MRTGRLMAGTLLRDILSACWNLGLAHSARDLRKCNQLMRWIQSWGCTSQPGMGSAPPDQIGQRSNQGWRQGSPSMYSIRCWGCMSPEGMGSGTLQRKCRHNAQERQMHKRTAQCWADMTQESRPSPMSIRSRWRSDRHWRRCSSTGQSGPARSLVRTEWAMMPLRASSYQQAHRCSPMRSWRTSWGCMSQASRASDS